MNTIVPSFRTTRWDPSTRSQQVFLLSVNGCYVVLCRWRTTNTSHSPSTSKTRPMPFPPFVSPKLQLILKIKYNGNQRTHYSYDPSRHTPTVYDLQAYTVLCLPSSAIYSLIMAAEPSTGKVWTKIATVAQLVLRSTSNSCVESYNQCPGILPHHSVRVAKDDKCFDSKYSTRSTKTSTNPIFQWFRGSFGYISNLL